MALALLVPAQEPVLVWLLPGLGQAAVRVLPARVQERVQERGAARVLPGRDAESAPVLADSSAPVRRQAPKKAAL